MVIGISVLDTIIQGIQGDYGAAAAEYWVSSSGLTQLIRAGTFQGMSGRAILNAYRTAGGSISDAVYWSMRRAVIQQMNPLAPFLNPYQSLVHLVETIEGGQAGRYQLNFRAYVQHSGPGGTSFYTAKTYSVIQDELDGAQGVEAMREASNVHDDPENDSLGRIVGYELASVWQYTG